MRERTLQSRVADALNGYTGCKAVVTCGLEAGTPDILGCYRGRAFALEIKVGGQPLTPMQRHRLDQWRTAGAYAAVAREDFSVREFLEAIGEEADGDL